MERKKQTEETKSTVRYPRPPQVGIKSGSLLRRMSRTTFWNIRSSAKEIQGALEVPSGVFRKCEDVDRSLQRTKYESYE